MQTALADFIRDSPDGREADAILRSCVHCGFCLPACPTYQLLGDELDSPRGRIYLMKQLLEGEPVTTRTQLHLDRCLTCRACESACPSGVRYGRLLDIGRTLVEERVPRAPPARLQRWLLRRIVPYTQRVRALLGVAASIRPLLPRALRARVPAGIAGPGARLAGGSPAWPQARHARRVVLLEGCVQPVLAAGINPATAQVLDRIGIGTIRVAGGGCCGALAHHLAAQQESLAQARGNVDALWPHVAAGAEAVVFAASACAAMVCDYGRLLSDDPAYAARAERISAIACDISQLLAANETAVRATLAAAPTVRSAATQPVRVAFQAPCTLQHALRAGGLVEPLLQAAGFTLTAVADGGRCCGSAGTYSVLQPELSVRLLRAKLSALEAGAPQLIATANIGCLAHLRSGTTLPVHHWIELLAARLAGG
jgi:glycolate oxidase iron-sulfur subunit